MTNNYSEIMKQYANEMDEVVLADVMFAAGTLTCLSSDLLKGNWSKEDMKEEALLAVADMYACLGKLSAYCELQKEEVEREVNLALESIRDKIELR